MCAYLRVFFHRYFQHYHKFLPFLNPLKPPDYYYRCSHLLFWAIIAVASRRYNEDLSLLTSLSRSVPRLLWSVLQPVPHSYHDVKALCLLCTWPFPLSSSSRDPTLMLSGTMINLCLHFGLHRPNHAQDFSKFKVALPFEDLQDRMATWNACKIVAQRFVYRCNSTMPVILTTALSVATGYGQPSFVPLDNVLISQAHNVHAQQISQELRDRLQIESFCQRIAKTLDCMSHSREAVPNDEVVTTMQALKEDLSQLQKGMDKSETGGREIFRHFLYASHLLKLILSQASWPCTFAARSFIYAYILCSATPILTTTSNRSYRSSRLAEN